MIVAVAGAILVCGLVFARRASGADQPGRRADARRQHYFVQLPCLSDGAVSDQHPCAGGGFVYSWSRLSTIFTAFVIAYVLDRAGLRRIRVNRAAMLIVMLAIGLMGPRTTNLALEEI